LARSANCARGTCTNFLVSQFGPNGKTEKTGTLKILDWCREGHCPQPIWKEQAGSLYVTFLPAEDFKEISSVMPESGVESGQESGQESEVDLKILKSLKKPKSRSEIAKGLGHKTISGSINRAISRLLGKNLIEYTIPDKPQSRLQKYRLTGKGKLWLKKDSDKGE
jgi:ATP-dependent DNA helicase RecG